MSSVIKKVCEASSVYYSETNWIVDFIKLYSIFAFDCSVVDALSTDEDEIDDESEQYLEAVQRKIDKARPKAPFPMATEWVDVSSYKFLYNS
jgi:hypothetical protein